MTRQRLRMAVGALTLAVVAAAGPTMAKEPAAEVDWENTPPLSGQVEGGIVVLDGQVGGAYPLTVITEPPLTGSDIVLTVGVRVVEAASPGYLELWVVYADGSRYFSRSFDSGGEGILVTGYEETVQLPFALAGTVPAALELNAILPAGGRLEIGSVLLFQGVATDEGWWSGGTAGLAGGLLGGAIGILGAIVGFLAQRGQARRFVMGTLVTGGVVGAIAVLVGVIALVSGQPTAVTYPLLLLGVIMAAVFGGSTRSVSRRYAARELARMRAYDLV